MANMLVETLAGDFDPSEFEDDYAEAVEALVKAKLEGGEVKKTPTSTKPPARSSTCSPPCSESVAAAKTARGEASAGHRGRRVRGRGSEARQEGSGEEGRSQEDRQEVAGEEDRGQEAGQEGQLVSCVINWLTVWDDGVCPHPCWS